MCMMNFYGSWWGVSDFHSLKEGLIRDTPSTVVKGNLSWAVLLRKVKSEQGKILVHISFPSPLIFSPQLFEAVLYANQFVD